MKLFGINIRRAKKKQPKAAEEKAKEEVKAERVKGRIAYEIVREKDERSTIVKKGKLSPKKLWVNATVDGVKRRFYADHIIKETLGKKVRYYVRWNMQWSEAFGASGEIEHDETLENNLMNDMESQLGKAVGAAVGFVLERPMIYLLIMAFLFSAPIGFSYNDLFHLVPSTVVHWVPRR